MKLRNRGDEHKNHSRKSIEEAEDSEQWTQEDWNFAKVSAEREHKGFKKEAPQKTWENWKVSLEPRTLQPTLERHVAMTHATPPLGNNCGGGTLSTITAKKRKMKKKKRGSSYSYGRLQIKWPRNRGAADGRQQFPQATSLSRRGTNGQRNHSTLSLPKSIGWRKDR